MGNEKAEKSAVAATLAGVLAVVWLVLLGFPSGWHMTRCQLDSVDDIFCLYEYHVGLWQVDIVESSILSGASALLGMIGSKKSELEEYTKQIQEVVKPAGKYWSWDLQADSCKIVLLDFQRKWCDMCTRLAIVSVITMATTGLTALIFMAYAGLGIQNKLMLFAGATVGLGGVITYGVGTASFPDGEQLTFGWAFYAAAAVGLLSLAPGALEKSKPKRDSDDEEKDARTVELVKSAEGRDGTPENPGPGMPPSMGLSQDPVHPRHPGQPEVHAHYQGGQAAGGAGPHQGGQPPGSYPGGQSAGSNYGASHGHGAGPGWTQQTAQMYHQNARPAWANVAPSSGPVGGVLHIEIPTPAHMQAGSFPAPSITTTSVATWSTSQPTSQSNFKDPYGNSVQPWGFPPPASLPCSYSAPTGQNDPRRDGYSHPFNR